VQITIRIEASHIRMAIGPRVQATQINRRCRCIDLLENRFHRPNSIGVDEPFHGGISCIFGRLQSTPMQIHQPPQWTSIAPCTSKNKLPIEMLGSIAPRRSRLHAYLWSRGLICGIIFQLEMPCRRWHAAQEMEWLSRGIAPELKKVDVSSSRAPRESRSAPETRRDPLPHPRRSTLDFESSIPI
jgi:hypothetical protein